MDSPLELETNDWKQTIKRAVTEIKEDRVTLVAAGMAYYFFLAVFPGVIAAIGILGLVDVDDGALVDTINSALPGGIGDVLTQAVTSSENPSQGASLIAALAGIAAALWSATSGMVSLQSGLNIAYDIDEDRKLLGKRGVAVVLIAAVALLGGVPTPLLAVDGIVWTIVRWIVTAICVMALFSIFYRFGPNRRSPRWRWVTLGGVVGAAVWLAASAAFGFYVSQGSYDKTYGPLADVAAFILWLYISALTILVGAELNAEVERQSEIRARV